jgi:hypothetical protein
MANIYRNYTGYCPHIEDDFEIDVEYAEVPVTKTTKRFFKHVGYDCLANDDDECTYANQNQCPIYKKAPVTIEI